MINVEIESINECPWCVETERKCGITLATYPPGEKCDFKSLPKEKDAILQRMREIIIDIKAKKEILKTSTNREEQIESVRITMDKLFGLEVMAKCMEREFNMSRADALKAAGYEGLSMTEKAKALLSLKKLQRGSK